MKIVVIDGQGGKMGGMLVKKLKDELKNQTVYAIGTNSTATSTMLKAGADLGATGENPVVKNCRDADVIIGPVGIIAADAILGEVTAKMAEAVGASAGKKVLIPVNTCEIIVVGVDERPLSALISDAVDKVKKLTL